MPKFEIDDVVYAVRKIDEPASGDSPGGRLCKFADKLIVRRESTLGGKFAYSVSHEGRTDGKTFAVHPHEISYMKHFAHNDPDHYVYTWKR